MEAWELRVGAGGGGGARECEEGPVGCVQGGGGAREEEDEERVRAVGRRSGGGVAREREGEGEVGESGAGALDLGIEKRRGGGGRAW